MQKILLLPPTKEEIGFKVKRERGITITHVSKEQLKNK